MIAGGFTCQRYGFNVGADKFSLLTIENGKNKHYAPIGMDIDFPKPKISLRQAASNYDYTTAGVADPDKLRDAILANGGRLIE